MELTSTKNPLLQKIRRAATTGRPTDNGLIVAEGPHLLSEAQRGLWAIEQIFVTAQARDRYRDLLAETGADVVEVSERALTSTAATDTPQNVLTLLRPRSFSWNDLRADSALVVVLDRMQDPGNVGTIVRSAEAFGATGIVLLKGCARVANGKVLRAAAGSLFRLPFLEEVSSGDLLAHAQTHDLKLYALAADGKMPVSRVNWRSPCALLVGSEGSGVAPILLNAAEDVSIPTENVESLNAAIACSIALYEARQQRLRT